MLLETGEFYTLNKKLIEWTWQFHGHGAALEIPCPNEEYEGILLPQYFPGSSFCGSSATHTGKGKTQ